MRNILVVGRGIAGAMLAWQLQRRGVAVTLAADSGIPGSSQAAAGVINAVTGKRYAVSWQFQRHWAHACVTYAQLETHFQQKFFQQREIVRLLGTPEEINNWTTRTALPDFQGLMDIADDAGPWAPFVPEGGYYGVIRKGGQVDFKALTAAIRDLLSAEGRFFARHIGPENIPALAEQYDALVFCEGAAAIQNAFFPEIAWQQAKGEGLLVRFTDPIFAETLASRTMPMLKKELMVAAPGGPWTDLCWVGANFSWEFPDDLPTPQGGQDIREGLERMVRTPFEVLGQFAGVRPVVRDRRPVIGRSAAHNKVFIFNGLGAKGALLAPYWSEHLCTHLLEGSEIDREVDVARFRG